MSLALVVGLVVAALAFYMVMRSQADQVTDTSAGGGKLPGVQNPTFGGLKGDAPTGQLGSLDAGLVISKQAAANVAALNAQARRGLVASLAEWNPENPGFLIGWTPPTRPIITSMTRSSADRVIAGDVGFYNANSRVKLPGVVDSAGRGWVYSKATMAFDGIDYHPDYALLVEGTVYELGSSLPSRVAVWDRKLRQFHNSLPPVGFRGVDLFPNRVAPPRRAPGNALTASVTAYQASAVYGYYRSGMMGDVGNAEKYQRHQMSLLLALDVVVLS